MLHYVGVQYFQHHAYLAAYFLNEYQTTKNNHNWVSKCDILGFYL